MNNHGIAREALGIASQIDDMKTLPDHELPLYFEDVRARVAAIGLDLEDVVKAGIYKLAQVPKQIIKDAAGEHTFESYLSTTSWRAEIEMILLSAGHVIPWHDRTFLRKLLLRPALTTREMVSAEFIISRATYVGFVADGAFEPWDDEPAGTDAVARSAEQLDLDV